MHSLRPKNSEVSCSRCSHNTTNGITTYMSSKYWTHIKFTWLLATWLLPWPQWRKYALEAIIKLLFILSQNYLLPIVSVLSENTLLKTTCHFLLLLLGFDTLTYRKDYRSPILVGHQPLTESQHTYHQNIKHTSSSYDYLQHDFSRDLKNKSNYSQLIIMRSEGY